MDINPVPNVLTQYKIKPLHRRIYGWLPKYVASPLVSGHISGHHWKTVIFPLTIGKGKDAYSQDRDNRIRMC
jgi:hypothetical protein